MNGGSMKQEIDPNIIDGIGGLLDAVEHLLHALRLANDALADTDFGNHSQGLDDCAVQARTIREGFDDYRRSARAIS